MTDIEQKTRRILCVGETWLGSDARAAFMAFRRLGHSVRIVDETSYFPTAWSSPPARALRKGLRALFVQELTHELCRLVNRFRPHCLFVFKGNFVHPDVLRYYRNHGIPSTNYYPDVSFMVHGPYLPKALPLYDHIFTTKSFGIADLARRLNATNASYLEHGFDPDLHRPLRLTPADRRLYECDVAFIGTWSPKKERILTLLKKAIPGLALKVWGCQWEKASADQLRDSIVGDEILADEYAKALQGAKIVLGLLSEQRPGASSGDLTTARTFQIPACGAFMLHERTADAVNLFEDGREAAFFSTPDELVEKVVHYLRYDEERINVARCGRNRSERSGYSVDARMRVVLNWLDQQELPIW